MHELKLKLKVCYSLMKYSCGRRPTWGNREFLPAARRPGRTRQGGHRRNFYALGHCDSEEEAPTSPAAPEPGR